MQLTVTTIIFGLPSGQRTIPTHLVLPATTLTVRELITHKVRQEVAEVAAHKRPGLSGESCSPEELMHAKTPETLLPGEVHAEIARAQQAFAARDFMIVIDNQRILDPDHVVTLQPETRVEFIKILPLVGG